MSRISEIVSTPDTLSIEQQEEAIALLRKYAEAIRSELGVGGIAIVVMGHPTTLEGAPAVHILDAASITINPVMPVQQLYFSLFQSHMRLAQQQAANELLAAQARQNGAIH